MRISLITACYNSAATIADTLQSVGQQSFKDVEHIIIDGLSTDNTLEIVREFPHVAKIITEKDHGIYDAMNKGIDLASGDIVGIINSDDMYANNEVLKKVAEEFRDPQVKAMYADLQYVDQEGTDKIVRQWKSGPFKRSQFYYGWMPPHPTFFVRRELYEQFGKFNTSLHTAADYELMLRFLLKHKVEPAYLPEVIVKMRTGGLSNVSFANRWRANKEDRMAWRLNGLKPNIFTRYLKPFRKLPQFLNF